MIGCPTNRLTESAGEPSTGSGQVIWGTIGCHPFAEQAEARVPVVDRAVVCDIWINGLDQGPAFRGLKILGNTAT